MTRLSNVLRSSLPHGPTVAYKQAGERPGLGFVGVPRQLRGNGLHTAPMPMQENQGALSTR